MKHVVWVLCLCAAACSDDSDGRQRTTGTSGGRSTSTGGASGNGGGTCTGVGCFTMDCGSQPATSVSGRVTAPNGLDPVYEALVYVPTTIPEFSPTVQCEVCNEPIGGTPVVSTTTAVDGTFRLSNIPVTSDVPVVIQKGRFRRTIHLTPTACADNPLAPEQARLPRNQSEGDLPKMAVGLGDYDQIECVLRSIGIDASEFTAPSGSGAVHLYANSDSLSGTTLESLLSDPMKMAGYNLIFVNCTGTSITDYADPKGTASNLHDYVAAGGRLYVTDWSYDYMEQVPEFAPYIYFDGGGDMVHVQPAHDAWWVWSGDDITAQTSDATMTDWLKAAGATPNGQVTLIGSWALAKSANSDQMTYPSTTWVHGKASGLDRPMTATFDYNSCGKVLWSSYHTQEPGAGLSDPDHFPKYCQSTAQTMIPQEKILEYLIFEISSCVGPVG